ncbi:MAG: serine hydrolase domain-containing protein [Thermodesulfobacteriota bacterium]
MIFSNAIDRFMEKGVRDRVFPGAVLLVACRAEVVHHQGYGLANLYTGTPVTTETLFDLASLTKPLATALSVIKLIETGRLRLDHSLEALFPETAGTDKGPIRIDQLLVHNSGLPDYRPFYKRLGAAPLETNKSLLRNRILKEPLIGPIGRTVLYSDLGFMLLDWVIERVSGTRPDRFIGQQVYAPLGLDRLFFVDLEGPLPEGRFAATEHCPWRNRVLEGWVHDENAFISGGIQGHAGLFGTAAAVYRLLSILLTAYHRPSSSGSKEDSFFPGSLVRTFLKPFEDTGRSLGFDRPSPAGSSCGALFSAEAVGHLGFTGTSFWMDLERSVLVILLTNRVHPSRNNVKIRGFRPVLHDWVMKELGYGRKAEPGEIG